MVLIKCQWEFPDWVRVPRLRKIYDQIFPSLDSFQSSNILKTITITNHAVISEICKEENNYFWDEAYPKSWGGKKKALCEYLEYYTMDKWFQGQKCTKHACKRIQLQ